MRRYSCLVSEFVILVHKAVGRGLKRLVQVLIAIMTMALLLLAANLAQAAPASSCDGWLSCPETGVGDGAVWLSAKDVTGPDESGLFHASTIAPGPQFRTWR